MGSEDECENKHGSIHSCINWHMADMHSDRKFTVACWIVGIELEHDLKANNWGSWRRTNPGFEAILAPESRT